MPIVNLPDFPSASYPAYINAQIINAKWDNAQYWFGKAFDFADEIKADVGVADQVPIPDLTTIYSMVQPPANLTFDDPAVAMQYFNDKNLELTAIIDEAFDKMVGIAFPDTALLADAVAWCKKAINVGGTGINEDVERALWERSRTRMLKEAARNMADATEKYARAGWPLPPGAMLHTQTLIQQDVRDKLAEQNRDIAIKSFEAEMENIKFAIKTAGDLFIQALQAVGDYVKTIMLAPQTAADLTQSISGIKNEAAKTLVSLYNAQSAALDPFIKLEVTDAELKARAQESNLKSKMQTAEMRMQSTMANLKMVGDAAASSLNGISAGAGNSVSTNISE